MTVSVTRPLLMVAGIVLLVTGAALTPGTADRLAAARAALAEQARYREALARLAQQVEPMEARREAFEAIPATGAVDVDAFVRGTAPGLRPRDVRREAEPLVGDWERLQIEFALDEAPVGRALSLIAAGMQQRPPWRLNRCVVRASAGSPGEGTVVLAFEVLSRMQ